MKVVRVVAAVICDSLERPRRYLLLQEVMVISKVNGSSRAEKSRLANHRRPR